MQLSLITIIFICIVSIHGQYLEYPNQTPLLTSSLSPLLSSTFTEDKSKVITFLHEYDREASEMCTRVTTAEWRYTINSTDFNKRRMREQQTVATKFDCISWRKANTINSTGTTLTTLTTLGSISSNSGGGSSSSSGSSNINGNRINIGSNTNYVLTDPSINRQIQKILNKGYCGLDDIKFMEFNHVLTLMKDNFNNGKICPYNNNNNADGTINDNNGYQHQRQYQIKLKQSREYTASIGNNEPENYVQATRTYCNLKLDPDIIRIMQQSRSEDELRYIWATWRNAVGPSIKNTFMRYIDLANQAAQAHGFRDAGEQMRSIYDDPDFYFTVQDLWLRIQPFYKQLFTFVRKGLIKYYGDKLIRRDGPIPAHLFGDVWAQNWKNIIDIVKLSISEQYEMPDITRELIRQGYTPLRIHQTAEDFFTSIGLPPMLPEFWRNSVLQKSNENIFTQCMPSAWDFCNGIDFRIKQCTRITLEDLINSHQQMAHIEYFMHYANLPIIYRDGPNPAFHEAISNAIGLCVAGPVHLQKLGLITKSLDVLNGNSLINIEFLLNVALDKIPFMAFSLVLERWRWYVFEKGPIGMNSRWWELSLRYMGIRPPVLRTNEHFDPGSKYHVIANKDYIKYFVATILQFQIFYEMCQAAGHIGPLHTCDFYRSRDAGRILTDIMQQGASIPSSQILKILTRGRTSKISVEPLLEYFRPLIAWLEIQNRNEIIIGWNSNMEDVNLYHYQYQSLNNGNTIRLYQNKFNLIMNLIFFYIIVVSL